MESCHAIPAKHRACRWAPRVTAIDFCGALSPSARADLPRERGEISVASRVDGSLPAHRTRCPPARSTYTVAGSDTFAVRDPTAAGSGGAPHGVRASPTMRRPRPTGRSVRDTETQSGLFLHRAPRHSPMSDVSATFRGPLLLDRGGRRVRRRGVRRRAGRRGLPGRLERGPHHAAAAHRGWGRRARAA